MKVDALRKDAAKLVERGARLPEGGIGTYARIQAGVTLLVALEGTNMNRNIDPLPALTRAVELARGVVDAALSVVDELDSASLGGNESLDGFRLVLDRYKLSNIEVREHDVTDLSPREDNSYDFVAPNGVLHHTDSCVSTVISLGAMPRAAVRSTIPRSSWQRPLVD